MGLFQHPHLVRGVVHTAKGSFAINRGLVEVPDDIGESYGWLPLDFDDDRTAGIANASHLGRRMAGVATPGTNQRSSDPA